jgi:hypothetical protein
MSDGTELAYERHFTRDEANALLPMLKPLLRQLRDAKDELTDEEAHEVLSDAAETNGGGEEGHQVGVAFLEVRRLLVTLEESGIVLRDIDRGLVDFPAMLEGQEVYLCWELGEDEVEFWHELSSGYRGRQALD